MAAHRFVFEEGECVYTLGHGNYGENLRILPTTIIKKNLFSEKSNVPKVIGLVVN